MTFGHLIGSHHREHVYISDAALASPYSAHLHQGGARGLRSPDRPLGRAWAPQPPM
jgi:hypothetical protein